jgi:hypothetical protein
MSSEVKRHITEHEQLAGLSKPAPQRMGPWRVLPHDKHAGIRAALRHKLKLRGLDYHDDKMHMTDEEFSTALDSVRGHVANRPGEPKAAPQPKPAIISAQAGE